MSNQTPPGWPQPLPKQGQYRQYNHPGRSKRIHPSFTDHEIDEIAAAARHTGLALTGYCAQASLDTARNNHTYTPVNRPNYKPSPVCRGTNGTATAATTGGSATRGGPASTTPSTTGGAPKVNNPLDASKFLSQPCSVLSADQLKAFNLTRPERPIPSRDPAGLEDRRAAHDRRGQLYVATRDGLDRRRATELPAALRRHRERALARPHDRAETAATT